VTRGAGDYEGESVRHLYGTVLAVVMTAVMFFAGAWGYLQLLKLPVPPGRAAALPAGGGSLLSNSTALLALAAVLVTAVLVGVLAVVPRISPLASGLPGLLLLAWTALFLVSVRRAVEFIPLRSASFGAGWEGLLFNGVLGAAGAVMIIPVFIPSRWRKPGRADAEADIFPSDADDADDADDYFTAGKADPGPRERQERQWEEQQREEQPLVGTVLTRPAGVRRVDTTRITGASRALRNTSSFRGAGPQSRATGAFRTTGDPARRSWQFPAADD
jgi:hypothetical protein